MPRASKALAKPRRAAIDVDGRQPNRCPAATRPNPRRIALRRSVHLRAARPESVADSQRKAGQAAVAPLPHSGSRGKRFKSPLRLPGEPLSPSGRVARRFTKMVKGLPLLVSRRKALQTNRLRRSFSLLATRIRQDTRSKQLSRRRLRAFHAGGESIAAVRR